MQVDVIRTLDELDALAEEWNDLLACSASHVPFLRHEYLTTWWRTLGGGEWARGELYVVVARHENGELGGVAPLFIAENLEGQATLMFLGSIEISDYLDIIVRPGDLSAFINTLLEHLAGSGMPALRSLDLYNLVESSPTLPALKRTAERLGWEYTQEQLQHCPYIPLPGDWDTYLAGINKKQRHEIRRKMRRAENYELPVRWYIVEDEATLDTEIDAFLGLMAQDAEKELFLTEVMRSQMRAAVWAAFRASWLQLSFLEVDGEKAAGYLNFDYQDHIWVYNSGIDFKFSALSPGWVLLGYLLQWANQNGRKAFDFMRGDEAYKYRFGGIDRFVVRAKVQKSSNASG
jgi:CelD/BcsL family acetyltransferase involved in cellulose biosynthesis